MLLTASRTEIPAVSIVAIFLAQVGAALGVADLLGLHVVDTVLDAPDLYTFTEFANRHRLGNRSPSGHLKTFDNTALSGIASKAPQ